VRLSNHKTDIYTMRGDGSHKRRVARSAADPAFSPNGRKIVFARFGHSRKGDIYLMRANGSHKRRLTHARRSEFSPAFSPNGKRIIFQDLGVRDRAYTGNLYTIRTDGTHRKKLTAGTEATGLAGAPQFSPNGRKIVFYRACHIAVMRANGSGEQALTAPPDETCDSAPDFSPDGKKIAFAQDAREIFTMNADGSEPTPVGAPLQTHNDNPAFSPRSNKLAFDSDRRQAAGDTEIYSMSPGGSHVKRLTHGKHAVAYSPSWGVKPR
jgi:TolB protein